MNDRGMDDRGMDELKRWMTAEREDSRDAADRLFARLASFHLPRAHAPVDLAARIMAAIPRRVVAVRPRAFADVTGWWGVRVTAAAAVVVLGVAFAVLPAGQLFDIAASAVDAAARLTHGVVTSLSAALGLWIAVWTLLISLGRAAMLVTTSGLAPVVIGASLLLACAACAGLARLLSPVEEYC